MNFCAPLQRMVWNLGIPFPGVGRFRVSELETQLRSHPSSSVSPLLLDKNLPIGFSQPLHKPFFISTNGNIFTVFSFSTVSEDDPRCLMLFSLVVLQPIDAKGWNFLLYNCSQLPVLIAPGRSSLRQARAFDAERERVCQGCLGIC